MYNVHYIVKGGTLVSVLMVAFLAICGCGASEEVEMTFLLRKDGKNTKFDYPKSFAMSNMLVCQYYLQKPNMGSEVRFFDIANGRCVGSHMIPFWAGVLPVGETLLAICPVDRDGNPKASIKGYFLDLSDFSKSRKTAAIWPGAMIGISDGNLVVECHLSGPTGRTDYRLYNLTNGDERVLGSQQHGLDSVRECK